jgi:hypothetical protein
MTMTAKKDQKLQDAVDEFEKDNPPPPEVVATEAPAPSLIIADEAVLDTVRRAYAAYVTQLAIRTRPACPFTFDELNTEERNGWLAAYAEIAPP